MKWVVKIFHVPLGKKEDLSILILLWEGSSIKMETLKKWDEQPLMIEDEGIPLTLKEVVGHHEAEIWSYSCRDAENNPI
jgi:hypothetical protein